MSRNLIFNYVQHPLCKLLESDDNDLPVLCHSVGKYSFSCERMNKHQFQIAEKPFNNNLLKRLQIEKSTSLKGPKVYGSKSFCDIQTLKRTNSKFKLNRAQTAIKNKMMTDTMNNCSPISANKEINNPKLYKRGIDKICQQKALEKLRENNFKLDLTPPKYSITKSKNKEITEGFLTRMKVLEKQKQGNINHAIEIEKSKVSTKFINKKSEELTKSMKNFHDRNKTLERKRNNNKVLLDRKSVV